jgi:hypothetical protein
MGVAALVLGIIAIVVAPLGGLGGVFFGIVAVVLGVLGRRAAQRDRLPHRSATAGLVTGLVGIVLGAALFTLFMRCAEVEAEARGIAEEIARREMAYFEAERFDEKGNRLPQAFASAAAVPAKIPCQRKPVMVTPEDWRAAGWDRIHFGPAGPAKFQVEAVTRGEGKDARLLILVRVDPDCDGTLADLPLRVAVNAEGRPYRANPGDGWRHAVRPGLVPGTAAPPDDADLLGEAAPERPARPAAPRSPARPAGAR